VSDTQARQAAIRAEPLTDNERKLAQTAFARDQQAAKWGNLVLQAYDGRVAELERVTAALRVLADSRNWEVTPQYQEDGRYRFNCPPDSVYATPWGYAGSFVAGAARPAQEDE
jgi:hypothetical protein